MIRSSAASFLWMRVAACLWLLLAAAGPAKAATIAGGNAEATAAKGISLAEYHARLQGLDALLARCQSGLNAANCSSGQVGPDTQIALGKGLRQIRFGWLRTLLDEAAKGPAATQPVAPAAPPEDPNAPATSASPPASTLAERLQDARRRLAEDALLAEQADQSGNATTALARTPPRAALEQILAAKEYQAAVRQPTLMDRALEKVGKWIGRAIEKLTAVGAKSKWLGLAAEIGFVALLCVGLVWLLIRLERQGRFSIATIRSGAGAGAASARDWQLWLADARQAAGQGDWRRAIHLTYWASISRLESSGLWPADRARTPREYLALLSEASTQRPDLALLTRSFERTWYAGLPAEEVDFLEAEQLAGKLGAR